MIKKAKLYSLLAIIVASTVVGLFGFSQTALAQVESGCEDKDAGKISWTGSDNRASGGYWSSLCYAEDSYSQIGSAAQLGLGGGFAESACNEAPLVYVHNADDTNGTEPGDGGYHVICFAESGSTGTFIYFEHATLSSNNDFDPCGQNPPSCDPVGDPAEEPITIDGDPVDIADAQGQFEDDTDTLNSGDIEEPSSCQIKGIGWIICPIVMFLAEVTDASYTILDHTFLRLEPIVLPGGSEGDGIALYNTWKGMRDFANIIFIIGFLLIVFSQITSIGIGNYGIKRLLPKIIIAAILVNLSFYICVIGVDLSNILGNSLRGIFDSAVVSGESGGAFSFTYTPVGDSCGDACMDTEVTSWEALAYLIVGGAGVGLSVALTGAALYAFLPVFLPMIIGAVLAVLTVILALTLRQALIVILVVMSPLAFVALLLPNTEDYFKKWRSLFMAMLLVYPIISVVFGASALASRILMATDDFPVQVIGAGVSIIPLFLTPIIMKVSGGLLNRWVGLVNDPSKGFFDNKRNALAEQGKVISARRKTRGIGQVSGTGGQRFLGGANSRRRRAAGYFGGYGEKIRKNNLAEAESDAETAYLGTAGGRAATNDAANAQKRAGNAQINAETVRLSSAEGITLQVQATTAETAKHAAEAEAQTAAIRAIPHALEAQVLLADTNKKAAEDEGKGHALSSLAGSPIGQAALARAEDAKNANLAAEKSASAVGLSGANRATAAAAENATLGAKIAEDNLAEEVAPLVSQTARVMAKSADITKQTAVTQAETNATDTFNSSMAGRDALGNAKNAELLGGIADNDTKAIGIARANQEFKIQAETSSEALNTRTNQDKQLYEEIAAKGTTDPRFDPTSFGVSATTADAARDARIEQKAVNNAVTNAGRQGEIEYSKEIKRDAALANRAGGRVDPKGSQRAISRATTVENAAFNEAVKDEKNTMTDFDIARLAAERDNIGNSAERRAAATGMLASDGGMSDVINTFNKLASDLSGAIITGNATEMENIKSMQQQFMADVGNKLPESVIGASRGKMKIGQYTGGLDTEILSSLREGKYNGEMLAKLHPKELQEIKDVLTANRAGFSAADLSKLGELQSSIIKYKAVAPDLGEGITPERLRPMTGIESI